MTLKPLGAHSRAIRRGVIGDKIDGRSAEAKFLKKIAAELANQIGREPTFAESMLIRRASRSMLQLEILDSKLMLGNWSEYDSRVQGGLNNNVRLCLRELGIKPAPKPKATLGEYLAAKSK